MPPDEVELRARLTGRNTDSQETIALRMANALEEIGHWTEYRYRLISSTREDDFARFKALLVAERLRVSRALDVSSWLSSTSAAASVSA
jgi:guanylate kinase